MKPNRQHARHAATAAHLDKLAAKLTRRAQYHEALKIHRTRDAETAETLFALADQLRATAVEISNERQLTLAHVAA